MKYLGLVGAIRGTPRASLEDASLLALRGGRSPPRRLAQADKAVPLRNVPKGCPKVDASNSASHAGRHHVGVNCQANSECETYAFRLSEFLRALHHHQQRADAVHDDAAAAPNRWPRVEDHPVQDISLGTLAGEAATRQRSDAHAAVAARWPSATHA